MSYGDDDDHRGGHRGGSYGPREMHTAKCSDCGADCQVPFKPAPDRPVYCDQCFQKHRKPRRDRDY